MFFIKMTKIQKINLIGAILLLGFCVSSYLYYVLFGSYLNLKWPHNTFLYDPYYKFTDLYETIRMSKIYSYTIDSALSANPRSPLNYFPFLYIIMHIQSFLGYEVAFVLYLISFLLMMFYL